MLFVYLDQCAASYLAKAEVGSDWKLIREKMSSAFSAGRMICPLPNENLIESSPCEIQLRIAIEDFFHCVSNGERFLDIGEMMIAETLRLVRPNHVIYPFGTIGVGWGRCEESARNAREANLVRREKMRQRIESHTNHLAATDQTSEEIFRRATEERCGIFWRDLNKFTTNPATPATDYELVWLMEGLIGRGLTPDEATKIGDAVRFHKWERISVNYFDLLLGSRWDHDHLCGQRPNYSPNDEIDRWRSAIALCYSDLYITDGYTADLCRRARVADHTSTRVYSARQTRDILNFIEGCT